MGDRFNRGVLFILVTVGTLLAGCSRQSAYPSRPMTLICPWSAGGGTDRVSRQVAVLLEEEIGVPVNVINATGGSGVTGHTRGALAAPDGYTLTMMTVELNMLHWRGLTNISRLDFEPLIQLNRDDAALFVRTDAPWKTPKELAKAIAESPQPLKASGTAQGGIWHVSLAGWLDAIGMKADDVTWISINGSSPSLQELISGGVQMVCCSLPEAQTLLDAGEVRCLGVMAENRVPGFPKVPTFREQGENWSIGGWRGLGLPLGVPADRAAKLTEALERVVAGSAYKKFMDSNGFNTSILPPEPFARALADDDARFEKILTGDAFQTVRKARYGPYVFPWFLAGALALSLLAMIAKGGLRRPDDGEPITPRGLARVVVALVWIVAFVVFMDVAGYVLTASGLLIAFFLALRVRPALAVGLALVLGPLTYEVFAVALRVPLPVGWLGW